MGVVRPRAATRSAQSGSSSTRDRAGDRSFGWCGSWSRASLLSCPGRAIPSDQARDRINVDAVVSERIENLFAKVLSEGTAHLLRSGLDRGRNRPLHHEAAGARREETNWAPG